MQDFFLFFRREASLCASNFFHYLLPFFLWLTGFFVFRLLLSDTNNAQALVVFVWFLFLWFFALTTMGINLYHADLAQDLPLDIILANRSLLAFVYAKWSALLLFSALPLWFATGLALMVEGNGTVANNILILFLLSGFLFLAQLALLINFLASLCQWGKGGGFFMVIIVLPLMIPCFLLTLSIITNGQAYPLMFFQLAYFILTFSFLPIASAFIIKQQS